MRERGHRRQGIVELVADHADHLLPGLHFLATQFRGELSQQDELVLAPVEPEGAAGQVVDLFAVRVADGEHAVAAAFERVAQGIGGSVQDGVEGFAFQALALAEQLARGEVAVDDAVVRIDEQHRDRRVLHHRVEQQLALHQRKALVAQCIAEAVVGCDQFRQLAGAVPGQAEAEIAVAITRHRAGERAEQGLHRREGATDVVEDQWQKDQRC
jgi:hypothetical protein